MILFQCEIPVDRHVVKKNGRQIYRRSGGQAFLGKKSSLIMAEKYMISFLEIQKRKQGLKTINEEISIEMIFHFSGEQFFTKKGVKKKTIPDLSNLYQLPEDCLQKAGIILNDNLIESHDGSRRLPSNRTALEITIRKFAYGEKKVLV